MASRKDVATMLSHNMPIAMWCVKSVYNTTWKSTTKTSAKQSIAKELRQASSNRLPRIADLAICRDNEDLLAGHFDVDKTLELINRKYYWGSMRDDIKSYVKTCDVCQRVKVKRHRPYGELNSLPQPSGPWK